MAGPLNTPSAWPPTSHSGRSSALLGMLAATLAGVGIMLAAVAGERPEKKADRPKAVIEPGAATSVNSPWKEKAVVETPGWLPGSVAYSSDGKMMLVGGTSGQVSAFDPATRKEKWKADVGGNFAAVAFSVDGKSVLATFNNGVR